MRVQLVSVRQVEDVSGENMTWVDWGGSGFRHCSSSSQSAVIYFIGPFTCLPDFIRLCHCVVGNGFKCCQCNQHTRRKVWEVVPDDEPGVKDEALGYAESIRLSILV